MIVTEARETDIPAITEIYAHHVNTGLGSFEESPPEAEEMRRRYVNLTARGYPYLVAEKDGIVIGYAYAAPFHTRTAYRYTVEDSIYLASEAIGQGIGGALLDALIVACTNLGFRQMVAVIGDRDNANSIGLHRSRDFAEIGTLRSPGFKFGRWVDVVFMQRALGEGDTTLPDLIF